MNFFELLTYLVVTAAIGATVGMGLGLLDGEFARDALWGAIVVPVFIAAGIQFSLFISSRSKSCKHKK